MEIIIMLGALALMYGISVTSYAAMVAGLVAFGTLGFWILAGLVATLMLWRIEEDDGESATVMLVIFLGLQQFFGADILRFALKNPSEIAWAVLAYFVAGTVWCAVKWWFHVKDVRRRYDERREKFIRDHNGKGRKDDWDTVVRIDGLAKPLVSDNKERILRWMSFWPLSMIWTIINDPVKRAFREIFHRIKGWLQAISDKAFEGTEDDF